LLDKNLKCPGFDSRSIGVFDSGFGGLTIMKSLIEKLPSESIIYFGDSANAPYGDRTSSEIIKYATDAADFLAQKNIKILIIACNTACACASKIIKQKLSIPVFEIITPSFQTVLKESKNYNIGVIATRATIRSQIYKKLIEQHNPKARVLSLSCPLFVPLLEEGHFDNKLALNLAEHYLKPLKKKKIDTLLLACTHYPLMKGIIQKVMGDDVKVIDPSLACALNLLSFLEKNGISSLNAKPKYEFYTSGDTEKFKNIAEVFLEKKIDQVLKK